MAIRDEEEQPVELAEMIPPASHDTLQIERSEMLPLRASAHCNSSHTTALCIRDTLGSPQNTSMGALCLHTQLEFMRFEILID